ncbi:glutamate-1-semialdehyde aminotransferase [Liquorilactobacillus sucicola DSM 21376 = JCM 15457]|nr:aminotransferase class III-fold pyridoxal phosphate-dependent enzyme [Liquorilactobacillus sucicola]GAJ27108.1 glutamate-1-semialdehyde aminotransferase [Liquorilactobacillus sucicola DSM 21376 = JCM 15457]
MAGLPPELVSKYAKQPDILGDKKRLTLTNSFKELERAKKVIPDGVYGMRGPAFFVPGEYPIYIDHGKNCHMWDIDGNEYIDFIASYGPTTLGFVEDSINDAVKERIDKGFSFSLPQIEQTTLAEKLCKIIPGAEKVVFARTGTDTTSIAIRIARAYTKKEIILTDGYHGWGEFSQYEPDAGIPEKIRKLTVRVPYGRADLYEENIKKGNVAAIMVTPIYHELMEKIYYDKKFLEDLRELSTKYDIPLIFDEVRSGFRTSLGGAAEYIGVTPDITCLSKAIANGYILGAVSGKTKLLQMVAKGGGTNGTYISSTFFLNSLEMVAANKTIAFYIENNVNDEINRKGEYFSQKIDEIIEKHHAPMINAGIPSMPSFLFDKKILGEELWAASTFTLFSYLIRSGIFMHPYHQSYIAYRHTKKDLDKALNALDKGIKVVKELHPWD